MWSVCLRVSACGSPWEPASGWGDEPCRDTLLGSLWLRPRTLARRRPELSAEEAPRFLCVWVLDAPPRKGRCGCRYYY